MRNMAKNIPSIESSLVEDKHSEKPIDRQKTCPLLLRVFCSNGRHNNLSEYNRGNVPQNELQIYTWLDASLQELTSLVKEVNPEARKKGTYFEFALVYPDSRTPTYRMREIGVTCTGQKGPHDSKTLHQLRFCIGDYMDIAIYPYGWNPGRRLNNHHSNHRVRPY